MEKTMQLNIKTKDLRLDDLNKINKASVVYIWGGGCYSKHVADYICDVGKFDGQIKFIVDDEYWTPDIPGVMKLSTFIESKNTNFPVVFGFYDYPLIQKKKKLWARILPNIFDFHFTVVNDQRLRWNSEDATTRKAEYQKTYDLLSDQRSKRLMQFYLNAATAGEFHELFTEFFDSSAYFNAITKNLEIDTLIDCGAYDGDSIHAFIRTFPNYHSIVAVEPDPLNLTKLRKRKEEESIRGLEILEVGLGSRCGELRFKVNGKSNSFLDEKGEHVVKMHNPPKWPSKWRKLVQHFWLC